MIDFFNTRSNEQEFRATFYKNLYFTLQLLIHLVVQFVENCQKNHGPHS